MLHVTTNDANNYLLSTIVDKLTTAVHSTVAKEVGEETANQLLTGFGTIHASIVKAADGASQLPTASASSATARRRSTTAPASSSAARPAGGRPDHSCATAPISSTAVPGS